MRKTAIKNAFFPLLYLWFDLLNWIFIKIYLEYHHNYLKYNILRGNYDICDSKKAKIPVVCVRAYAREGVIIGVFTN